MSDGALSQDEIDALLAGVDSTGFGAPAPSPSSSISSADIELVNGFLSGLVESHSSNLAAISGEELSVSGPTVEALNREAALQNLPNMVVSIKANYTGSFSGDHLYILEDSAAKQLASIMNKEEDIELDEMALSVVSEVASQLSGTTITAFSNETGDKNLNAESPESTAIPKAVVPLPSGTFLLATWQLNLGEKGSFSLWEVFDSGVSNGMIKALGGGASEDGFVDVLNDFGMGDSAPAPAAGMGAMSGMGAMAGMGAPSAVQSVQFPSLAGQQMAGEQGNISLLMDVFMEMSVELGRTRKSVREILSMGEGTIIELDKLAGEPVDILVNHKLIAKGEVVIIEENFGVRVTEIVSTMERISDLR